MDRMLNSKRETESIYEIYRACRLCGGGAGYKMPIIQNIVDLEEADVDLKQKIRECVQIEVNQDDKMPPLICELCVDKVNDFYEFLEMCRQTNKRTRLRLGLPPQALSRGAPDAGDCILGLTEPVFVNEDSDGEPLSKHKKIPKGKVKKEPVVRIKIENLQEERLSRNKKREKTPPRITRHSKSKDEDLTNSSLKDKPKSPKAPPKSILKKESSIKTDDSSLLASRLKRTRDKEPVKLDTPPKKVKITSKSPPPTPSRQKISPKSSPRIMTKPPPKVLRARSTVVSPPVKRAPSPPKETFDCKVCGHPNKSSQARGTHLRSHVVGFTSPKLACNPCGEWFLTADEALSHQKRHKSRNIPYNCRRCHVNFKRLSSYDEHFEKNECIPFEEIPDVKCDVCWHMFATHNSLLNHRCLGEDHRPGGKCCKCNRSYALLKNLKKHESTCTAKKKGDLVVDKKLLGKLKPIQVRVARCDPLLSKVKQEHYDVSSVSSDFGLDQNCYYPYIARLRIKSEFPGMVDIQDEFKNEFCSEDFIHWDSEESDSEEEISCDAVLNSYSKKKRVESLSALALKTIFSQRFLGKVPRKRRKLKQEKVFDSLLGQDEVRMEIDSIIDNLRDDDDEEVNNTSDKGDKSIDVSTNLSQDASKDDKTNDEGDRLNDTNDVSDSITNDLSTHDSNNDTENKIVSSNDDVGGTKNNDSNNDNTSNDSISVNENTNNESISVKVNIDNDSLSPKHNGNNDNDDLVDEIKNNSVGNDDESTELIKKKPVNDILDSEKDISDAVSQIDQNSQENNSQVSSIESFLDNDSKNSDSIISNVNDTKIENNDSTNLNTDTNNASNDSIEFRLSNNVQNDSTATKNDSMSDVNDSNGNDKVNKDIVNDISDSNDKIALEDLLSKSTESKMDLGCIDDFSFDS